MPAEPRPPTSPLGCAVLCVLVVFAVPLLAALLGVGVRVFRWTAWGG